MPADSRKVAILQALRAFISQRPGMDPRNYDAAGYRSESREVTRDKHHAETLLRRIELADSISADDILKEASGGGRLTIKVQHQCRSATPGMRAHVDKWCDGFKHDVWCEDGKHERTTIDYCTGQYFPTEYRKAVARLAASVLWTWTRDKCMPQVGGAPVGSGKAEAGMYWDATAKRAVSAGDWLRAHFRREFGKRLASRYFD